jgi:hemoglobin/transferrin/lactoferrin receptor protein
MKQLITLLFFLTVAGLEAQSGRVTGVVVDQATGKPLQGANVFCRQMNTGTVTDSEGAFRFDRLPSGTHTVTASYIGYRGASQTVRIDRQPVVMRFEMVTSPLPVMDMTITIPRYATTLRETALPLGVVSGERLTATAPTTIADALQAEPGVALQRDGIWGTSVSVRGLSRSSIVTLIDGNRIDTATDLAAGLSLFDIYDIERIEVIKGAASALYGSGAMGGVVNIISRDGWYQERPYWHLRMVGGYSSVNNAGQGHLTFSTGAQKWYARFSGALRKADDAKTPKGALTNSNFRDNSSAVRLSVRPWRQHELKFNYQRFYAEDVGIPGAYPVFPTTATVRYPFEKRELYSSEYIASSLTRHLQQISVKAYHQKIWRDVENIPNTVTTLPAGNGQPARKVYALRILPGATHDLNGVQIQGNLFPGRHHLLVAGIDLWQKDYRGYRTKETRIDILNPDGSVKKSTYRTIGESPLPDAFYRSIGLYTQDEWRLFSERLVMVLGGRFDRIETQNQETLNPLYEVVDGVRNDTPAGQTLLWQAEAARNHSWSGNLSLLYRFMPQMDVTLNLARSFRAPSLEERYQYIDQGSLVKVGDPALAPEAGTFSDLGVRLWSERLQLQISGFYNRMKNLVADVPGLYEDRKALLKSNIGEAELYGGDFRIDFKPMQNCAVWARAGYVHGENLLAEEPLPQIAPLNGSVGYHNGCLSWFAFDLSAVMFSTQERIATGEIRTPGYAYYTLYLNSRAIPLLGSQMFLTLGIENLTNRTFRNHLSTNRGVLAIEPGRNILFTWRSEL